MKKTKALSYKCLVLEKQDFKVLISSKETNVLWLLRIPLEAFAKVPHSIGTSTTLTLEKEFLFDTVRLYNAAPGARNKKIRGSDHASINWLLRLLSK